MTMHTIDTCTHVPSLFVWWENYRSCCCHLQTLPLVLSPSWQAPPPLVVCDQTTVLNIGEVFFGDGLPVFFQFVHFEISTNTLTYIGLLLGVCVLVNQNLSKQRTAT